MDQRSTDLLNGTQVLNLQNEPDFTNRLVMLMDTVVEWSRIEALGWWEHTSDWDLEVCVTTIMGQEFRLEATPSYSVEIDGTDYQPWALLQHAADFNIHSLDPEERPKNVKLHLREGWVYDEADDKGHDQDYSFNLQDIATVWIARV